MVALVYDGVFEFIADTSPHRDTCSLTIRFNQKIRPSQGNWHWSNTLNRTEN